MFTTEIVCAPAKCNWGLSLFPCGHAVGQANSELGIS